MTAKKYLLKIIVAGALVSFIRSVMNLSFIIWSNSISTWKTESLEDDGLFWPFFITVYLLICDLLPILVIMDSIKPAPDTNSKKKVPVPELALDEDDDATVLEVYNY